MATYGDDRGRGSGQESNASTPRGLDGADARSTGLPAPVVPPPILPTASAPGAALPAPGRHAVASSAMPAPSTSPTPSMHVATTGVAASNSFTDIRAVHEATTQQLRERRVSATNGPSGRSVAVACAVVVVGGIAVVLGAVLL